MKQIITKKKLSPGEVIPLNMDFMFTNIFNKEENINILENFLSDYLEIPLKNIKGNLKLLKRKLNIDSKKEANNEVDLLFNYNGEYINIELSNERKSTGVIDRNIVFACKVHSKQLRKGEHNYNNIKETIQINLNNFHNNNIDIKEEYYLINKQGDILTKKFRIDMVDLALGSKRWYNKKENTKLSRWCRIFLSKTEKELRELIGGNFMEREASEKLIKEINDLSSDDEYVELYTDLSRKEMEYNTYIEEARQDGIKKGKSEIAKNMIKKGIDIKTISEITGLSINEIETLK